MNTKKVGNLTHDEASRKNIPTAEIEPMLSKDERRPIDVAYERCNRDLDPQLVWRGKDPRDWADLVVQAPPLFIQEKIHPKVLIDDLAKMQNSDSNEFNQSDLFADFNGLPEEHTRTEFYSHDANWTNRMILGDSLQVMASLAEWEELSGQVQCIFIDPPYGIKFNSNFQWQTNNKEVKDGDIPREPEQVKAYRDTWKDGIHSYLTYLRDRLTVARDLLSESGSIFVQIGEQNVHRVRVVMDEVFGESNFVNQINFRSNSGTPRMASVERTIDYLLWYAKEKESMKFRRLILDKDINTSNSQLLYDNLSVHSMNSEQKKNPKSIPSNAKIFETLPIHSKGSGDNDNQPREAFGKYWSIPNNSHWRFKLPGFERLLKAGRIQIAKTVLRSRRFHTDYVASELTDTWTDTGPEMNKSYVVQTSKRPIERCVLMVTDPGDIVLDPTCGSGTVAIVAEQWGRRWITIDTSRVALALARARLMQAKFDWYLLSDSSKGQRKEAEISNKQPSSVPTRSDIRQGFVYHRVPRITPNSIAENAEIDIIWKKYQEELEPLREKLNQMLKESWNEWDVPHEVSSEWPDEAKEIHTEWWKKRIFRQKEVDASIEANAEFKLRYDKPYIDKSCVRVSGPFTVESISPHRVMAFDENDELFDSRGDDGTLIRENQDFVSMIINQLRISGAQQVHKEDKIDFVSLTPWPGKLICAEGICVVNDSGKESRVAIFVGPEFGTVSRPDLVDATREAADAGFDMLVVCAFNYDVQSSEFDRIGGFPVLKARMHPDLHMAEDLSSTSKGNLFVIFGEPDIEIISIEEDQFQVKINGVDVFHPRSGELRSHGPEGIACWFLDSDYNGVSFFVRHAYFLGTPLGTPDPYEALSKTLKAEIDEEAWNTLKSNVSRPFSKPTSGRIAVKVINNLGDEVMKVFKVS